MTLAPDEEDEPRMDPVLRRALSAAARALADALDEQETFALPGIGSAESMATILRRVKEINELGEGATRTTCAASPVRPE